MLCKSHYKTQHLQEFMQPNFKHTVTEGMLKYRSKLGTTHS